MGLLLSKHMAGASLGVWEITEDEEELRRMSRLSAGEQDYLASLQSPLRRKHWLSYRLILPALLPQKLLSGVSYDAQGKPFLDNGARQLSVAHSGVFSAAIVSEKQAVGIDIEEIQPKIHRLAHKFLCEEEMEYRFPSHPTESLITIWCAKEALFKLYGKTGLSMREHILIRSFAFTGTGRLRGEIRTRTFRRDFRLSYETLANYLLVYVIDQHGQDGG